MKRNGYTIVLVVVLLAYTSLSFSELLAHAVMMASEHHGMLAGDYHMVTTEMVDCSTQTCLATQNTSNCLEHCLQATAQTTDSVLFVSTVTIVFVILVLATTLQLPVVIRRVFVRPREWFRPLYLFNTVQLLE